MVNKDTAGVDTAKHYRDRESVFRGGAFELNAAVRGYKVHGYDIDDALVNFWDYFFRCPYSLIENAKEVLGRHTKDELYDFQKNFHEIESDKDKATMLYILSMLGFGGQWKDGGILQHYFIDGAWQRNEGKRGYRHIFPNFEWQTKPRRGQSKFYIPLDDYTQLDISVQISDFAYSLERHSQFAYCDPPYMDNEKYYKTAFDHGKLADILRHRDNWILSYNDHPDIMKIYKGYRMQKKMRNPGISRRVHTPELIILSHDIAEIKNDTEIEGIHRYPA